MMDTDVAALLFVGALLVADGGALFNDGSSVGRNFDGGVSKYFFQMMESDRMEVICGNSGGLSLRICTF